MKKFNAVCTLILSVIVSAHILTMSYLYVSLNYNPVVMKGFAFLTMLFVSIHAGTSIIFFLFRNEGGFVNKYTKLNTRTIVQRISCLLVILLIHLHVNAFEYVHTGAVLTSAQLFLVIVTELIFFGSILTHLAVSFSRALITLGLIRSERGEKNTDRFAFVFCVLLMLIIIICIVPLAAGV